MLSWWSQQKTHLRVKEIEGKEWRIEKIADWN
jgi:hypothetical protein